MRHFYLSATLLLFSAAATFGEVTNDQILAALQAIDERIARIEERLDRLEEQRTSAQPGTDSTSREVAPEPSIVGRVLDAFSNQQEGTLYPWMDAVKWEQIKVGMSDDEVLEILGEPTTRDLSLNRLVDYIYTYRGRRVQSGERIVGKVKFRDDKVTEVELPRL